MSLYLRETGPSDAHTILLLHGGGASSWTWEPVVELLPDFHCLVPDLPAHGQSRNGRFTFQGAVDQLGALVEEHAPGQEVSLVGLSLGAQIGLSMLAEAPRRYKSAILSGLLAEPMTWVNGLIDIATRIYMPFRNIPWLVRANMKYIGVPDRYYLQFAENTRELTGEVFTDMMRANLAYEQPEHLDAVQTPTLILAGEKEERAIFRSARAIRKNFTEAKAMMVEGAIHNWLLQKPDLFAQVIRDWIEGQPLPPQIKPL